MERGGNQIPPPLWSFVSLLQSDLGGSGKLTIAQCVVLHLLAPGQYWTDTLPTPGFRGTPPWLGTRRKLLKQEGKA